MPSLKSSNPTRRAPAHAEQRDRAARLRDTAGRFTKGNKDLSPAQPDAPRGTVPAPANTPDGAYALIVQGDGLGLHAAPGASLVVSPEMPTGAGLAVFYMKGKDTAVVFDLTHRFCPEHAGAVSSGSELVPLIEVVEPATGRMGGLRSDRIAVIHRVTGTYTPVEVAEKHPLAPIPLPIMRECPEDMGEQYVGDAGAYPLVRKGETVVYDPSRREPVHGALCVMQWNGGSRDVMLTNLRQPSAGNEAVWFVDPVNRLGNRTTGPLYSSDGPYDADHLRSKIVGTVVGVLVPDVKPGGLRQTRQTENGEG